MAEAALIYIVMGTMLLVLIVSVFACIKGKE